MADFVARGVIVPVHVWRTLLSVLVLGVWSWFGLSFAPESLVLRSLLVDSVLQIFEVLAGFLGFGFSQNGLRRFLVCTLTDFELEALHLVGPICRRVCNLLVQFLLLSAQLFLFFVQVIVAFTQFPVLGLQDVEISLEFVGIFHLVMEGFFLVRDFELGVMELFPGGSSLSEGE